MDQIVSDGRDFPTCYTTTTITSLIFQHLWKCFENAHFPFASMQGQLLATPTREGMKKNVFFDAQLFRDRDKRRVRKCPKGRKTTTYGD